MAAQRVRDYCVYKQMKGETGEDGVDRERNENGTHATDVQWLPESKSYPN
jgi:hypothetical protein